MPIQVVFIILAVTSNLIFILDNKFQIFYNLNFAVLLGVNVTSFNQNLLKS